MLSPSANTNMPFLKCQRRPRKELGLLPSAIKNKMVTFYPLEKQMRMLAVTLDLNEDPGEAQ